MTRKKGSKHFFLQAAMEYLSTYGWAILMILIVLALLSNIGVFNSGGLGPGAVPGSCLVNRPFGPWTSTASLNGACSGLLPQYVSVFGTNSYVTTAPFTMGLFTITAWVYPLSVPTDGNIGQVIAADYVGGGGMFLYFSSGRFAVARTHSTVDYNAQSDVTLPLNKWSFVATTLDSSTLTIYVNGVSHGVVNPASNNPVYASIYIGAASHTAGGTNNFNGIISNVQIYNASLPASDIQVIYQEGIGGAPIDLQYLSGWWPLNGNANDYGGNRENGVPTKINYLSQWPHS